MNEETLTQKMEESFEGWKAVQDLEHMSIMDVYESAFRHGVEAMQEHMQKPTPKTSENERSAFDTLPDDYETGDY